MGSAVLGDAISAIREWSTNRERDMGGATDKGAFGSLVFNDKLQQERLVAAFNPAAVGGLMCRSTLSVGWDGQLYDCDFNQMLKMQWREAGQGLHLWEVDPTQVENREIATGDHCFGCTAGAGSSCGGALV